MTDQHVVDALAAIIFVSFTGMLAVASVSVAIRVGRWRIRHISPPALLYRDFVTISGLSFSFLSITVARVLELPHEYTRTVPWLLFSSTPALIGMAVFLYFEFFVIGHGGDNDGA